MQGASLVAQLVKNPPALQETLVPFLDWEDPLEKEMATFIFDKGRFWNSEKITNFSKSKQYVHCISSNLDSVTESKSIFPN